VMGFGHLHGSREESRRGTQECVRHKTSSTSSQCEVIVGRPEWGGAGAPPPPPRRPLVVQTDSLAIRRPRPAAISRIRSVRECIPNPP